ncbi:hypothetical protein [Larkinella terrae]|uniref:Uncharacterized protein n=1 Tax=Larkinella terrae TaxID=2025311 RepID=A0A7K0EMS6_9BACT|nr:hypothetical protein [Larkinella terrae]MRS63095.1 hypothetical protein [Larkinella terrae]
MRNQPRDVTGGDQVLSGIIPGLGLMNYILGWFTVPIEVFLRRDFGERYFTRANFFAGLIVLVIFRFASSLVGIFNPLTWLFGSRGGDDPYVYVSWMGTVIEYYFYLSIIHFLRIWWNDITGRPVHSYSSGRSWLRPIGWFLMGILNRFLNAVVRLLFKIIPKTNQDRLPGALPVLRDVDIFTERFVEPFTVFVFAIMCAQIGQTSMFFWLFFSVMALNFSTGARHQAQRSYVLDIRDQLIDAKIINDALRGIDSPGSERMEQFIKETAREAERTPEIIQVIEKTHPTLADAIAAMNPQLKKSVQRSNPPIFPGDSINTNGEAI